MYVCVCVCTRRWETKTKGGGARSAPSAAMWHTWVDLERLEQRVVVIGGASHLEKGSGLGLEQHVANGRRAVRVDDERALVLHRRRRREAEQGDQELHLDVAKWYLCVWSRGRMIGRAYCIRLLRWPQAPHAK